MYAFGAHQKGSTNKMWAPKASEEKFPIIHAKSSKILPKLAIRLRMSESAKKLVQIWIHIPYSFVFSQKFWQRCLPTRMLFLRKPPNLCLKFVCASPYGACCVHRVFLSCLEFTKVHPLVLPVFFFFFCHPHAISWCKREQERPQSSQTWHV